ncbi:MAG: hypothetical protein A2020_15140 [Lentisphaerae bacterium GWF2_45_14]|nr:MAG: hypothetical protein A2020_15140 [Lentisphaerae bacterium GWF2_45_14]
MVQGVIQALPAKKRVVKTIVVIIVVFSAAILAAVLIYLKRLESRACKYDDVIYDSASRHCIDPCLLKALIWKESTFNRNAAGGKGEVGLMQIMPGKNGAVKDWSDNHGIQLPPAGTLFDPGLNIEIGSWYLGKALRKWKEYKHAEALALCEYNAGPQRAKDWKPISTDAEFEENIKFRSTKLYVKAIIKKCEEYRKERKATP